MLAKHAIAVAGGGLHKAVPLRRPVAQSRKLEDLGSSLGVDFINPATLNQVIAGAIHQIEEGILLNFLTGIRQSHSRSHGSKNGDQQ